MLLPLGPCLFGASIATRLGAAILVPANFCGRMRGRLPILPCPGRSQGAFEPLLIYEVEMIPNKMFAVYEWLLLLWVRLRFLCPDVRAKRRGCMVSLRTRVPRVVGGGVYIGSGLLNRVHIAGTGSKSIHVTHLTAGLLLQRQKMVALGDVLEVLSRQLTSASVIAGPMMVPLHLILGQFSQFLRVASALWASGCSQLLFRSSIE